MHCDHAAFSRGIVPMIGRIPAIGGAAGNMDDPSAPLARQPVLDCKPRKLGCSGQVDPQRIFPVVEPFDVGQRDRVGGELPGVVDQQVDPPPGPVERFVPDRRGSGRVGQVGGNGRGIDRTGGMADHLYAPGPQRLGNRRADPARGTGDKSGEGGVGLGHGPCSMRLCAGWESRLLDFRPLAGLHAPAF